MKYTEANNWIVNKLKNELSRDWSYHNLDHTLQVAKDAETLAIGENCSEYEKTILKTACLYHDSGFLEGADEHEEKGAKLVTVKLKEFDYSDKDIELIKNMILATKIPQQPKSLLEKIICDADLYYLGTDENYNQSNYLRSELEIRGMKMDDNQWINFQIGFLEIHKYFTKTAINTLEKKKQNYADELKLSL